MTTKNSPYRALKAQADKIAATLKAAERGDKIDVQFAQKIEAARAKPTFTGGIVMDDKVIKLDIPWGWITSTSEAALSKYIVDQMRACIARNSIVRARPDD